MRLVFWSDYFMGLCWQINLLSEKIFKFVSVDFRYYCWVFKPLR